MTRFIIFFAFNTISAMLAAQTLTMESAVTYALERHPLVTGARAETSRQSALKRAAIDVPKTEVSLMRGQFNSIVTDENITIGQTIPFPVTMARSRKLATEMVTSARMSEDVTKNELAYRVRQAFNRLLYLKTRNVILERQDSLFDNLLRAAALQYQTGEITLLIKTLAETQRLEARNALERNRNDIEGAGHALRLLCRADFSDISGTLEGLVAEPDDLQTPDHNPSQLYFRQQVEVVAREKRLEASRALPEIKIAYFNQTLIGLQNIKGQDVYFGRSKKFDGFQFGLSVPLWFGGYAARTKALAYATELARTHAAQTDLQVAQQFNQALQELEKDRRSLHYYRDSALKAAGLLRAQTATAFRNGEVDYQTLLLSVKQALTIEEGYLNALYNYNESLITIHYLKGTN